MSELISAVEALDVRFPTSRELDGSDAMNPEPDHSAAYVTIRTSAGDEGYGLAFTVGRGNDVEVAAVRDLAPLIVGLPVEKVLADLRGFSRRLTGDSQLRWLGPEKGAIHMAAAANSPCSPQRSSEASASAAARAPCSARSPASCCCS